MTSEFPTCALCDAGCTDDDFCYGCDAFICDGHNDSPWGPHTVDDHELEDDGGDE